MRITAPVPRVSVPQHTSSARSRSSSNAELVAQILTILPTWHLLRRSDSDIPRPLKQEESSNRPNEAEIPPKNQEPVKKEVGIQR
ncbi:hypothetical protein NDU88_000354 [Pleurodeles waltl]|uniref:Uncharacterized protein n=1 Tax=Pleurodeles waltl TaxID=8319 RepID=A0AAV7P9F8_PLEWA|nr:hypothetical protein NDU88_000354 [Pleurodeles waltl]